MYGISQATIEALRRQKERCKQIAERLAKSGLDPIGDLGGGMGTPEVVAIAEISKRGNHGIVKFEVQFPKRTDVAPMYLPPDHMELVRKRVAVKFDVDGRPVGNVNGSVHAGGLSFTYRINWADGEWKLDWTVAALPPRGGFEFL